LRVYHAGHEQVGYFCQQRFDYFFRAPSYPVVGCYGYFFNCNRLKKANSLGKVAKRKTSAWCEYPRAIVRCGLGNLALLLFLAKQRRVEQVFFSAFYRA
jgi:hypothetical protein